MLREFAFVCKVLLACIFELIRFRALAVLMLMLFASASELLCVIECDREWL